MQNTWFSCTCILSMLSSFLSITPLLVCSVPLLEGFRHTGNIKKKKKQKEATGSGIAFDSFKDETSILTESITDSRRQRWQTKSDACTAEWTGCSCTFCLCVLSVYVWKRLMSGAAQSGWFSGELSFMVNACCDHSTGKHTLWLLCVCVCVCMCRYQCVCKIWTCGSGVRDSEKTYN